MSSIGGNNNNNPMTNNPFLFRGDVVSRNNAEKTDRSRRASAPLPKIERAMGEGINAPKRSRSASLTEAISTRASSFSLPKPLQNSYNAFNAAVSSSLRGSGFSTTSTSSPPTPATTKATTASTTTAPTASTAKPQAAAKPPEPPMDARTRATQQVKQEFLKETGHTIQEFNAVKDTPTVKKLIDAKTNEILEPHRQDTQKGMNSLQEKFIGLSVANKNGQSNTPQFQAAVKSAIEEAKTTLSNLPKAELSSEETKAKKSEINAIIRALTTLSGKDRPPKFNADQIQLKDLLGKPISPENAKNIYLLVSKMSKEELTQIVHQQLREDMTSNNYQNKALVFSNVIRQNSKPPLSQENLIDSSPLKPLLVELNGAYANSYRAIQENQQNMETGFKNAKTNLMDLYSSIKDSFGLQGGDFAKVIADAEAKVNAATPENQRAVLEETGATIKEHYSLLLNEMKQKVAPSGVTVKELPKELKDNMKAEIQSRMPQYKNAIYNDTPLSHGFDRIFAHLSSPAATDTVADTMKKNIDAKTKLANANPAQNGMDYKRA